MADSEKLKKALIPAIAIIGAAILIAVLVLYYPQLKKIITKTVLTPTPQVKITEIEDGKLPQNMPVDIVLDKEAVISRSGYTQPIALFQKGEKVYQVQSFIAFVTKKSEANTSSLYEDYLNKNKWKGVALLDKDNVKRLTAQRGFDRISITISKNSSTGQVSVDIFNLHTGPQLPLSKISSPSPTPTPNK